jgi:hypothetical protein
MPLQVKEVLMQAIDRFRRPEQLNLYHPPRKLPRWKQMPRKVRQDVIGLLVQMLHDHYHLVHCAVKQGEVEDE